MYKLGVYRSGRDKTGCPGIRFLAALSLCILVVFSTSTFAQLQPADVLILVNQDSPTSRYIAKLYRQYYPDITESQVLNLSGLADCSGPASTTGDEIITRDQYNQCIADPVIAYLNDAAHPERLTQIKAIVTTAGMPYRIEDTNPSYANAIYPAGSNPFIISDHESDIDAASVESELACLWYGNYGSNPFGLKNRMVNPYQGYRGCPVDLFERQIPGAKNFNWTAPISWSPSVFSPRIEGFNYIFEIIDRQFDISDCYLTARLDGPKNQGKSAIFAVREMLERAKRASNPAIGVNPSQAVALLDDAPALDGNLNRNRTFNVNYNVSCWLFEAGVNQPPNVTAQPARVVDDFDQAYIEASNAASAPTTDILNIGQMPQANDLCVMLDLRAHHRSSQADLDEYASANPDRDQYQGLVFLSTFGKNGDESSPPDYLMADGPLFNTINGAVFTSMESFNAVTMFSDVQTASSAQGKIIDFISMGGTAAIGHSFEPQADAAIDNEFLLYNLLADSDGNGKADLTFAEAAFTAIPYMSWCEVAIGDPLMQIAYGPGSKSWKRLDGDANNDGRINFGDMVLVRMHLGGKLNTTDTTQFNLYNDLCDVDKDGIINFGDLVLTRLNLGAVADW